MKFSLLSPVYGTTIVAALLSAAAPAYAQSPEPVAALSAPVTVTDLTLEEAVEKAISSNIDVRMLKLDSDSAFYTTRLTLFNTNATNPDSISSLNGAKSKYETAADAIRDHLVAVASWKTQENTVRLDVHKAFFDAWAAQEKLDLQNKVLKMQEWARTSSEETEKVQEELEAAYREAITKLNLLMNENSSKEWRLIAKDYSSASQISIEECKNSAYERRPDMIKAAAEKAFAQAKVDYINSYASLSTYPGRIAKNDLEKNELLWQKSQKKSDKEIEDNYAKVTRSRQAVASVIAEEKAAEEAYRNAYISFLSGQVSKEELAGLEEKWLATTSKRIESTREYNLAVANLQYSTGF
ncbi:hypothetical protein [Brevibacillus nitrificans]|uniref:hypothetical protein n=1 Tax=Brevibacillus nitrificans TaxID=651560 RepID=UPI00285ADDEF|nr:hypothetical protein [Brevibacillus nitrificans]MDR7316875.1 outer membrane protein TolC [Brevibacillus nitrificans]